MERLFDLSMLEVMDDNEYVADILQVFLQTTPVEMNDLRKVCVANDFDGIHKMAHKLKSSASLLEAHNLLNVLIKIEECAKAQVAEDFSLMAMQANEEYKLIEVPLKEHLKKLQIKI